MVPHPPIMLPEVGRGEEKEIQATTDAYRIVAEKIAELKPETIIISSPHSIMYADYFHVSPGKRATGDMGRFRAGQVKFDVEYDTDLVAEICAVSDSYGQEKDDIKSMEIQGFPAGTMGERDPELDHGTMIPLYYIREKYKGFKIVRIGLSGLSLPMHYEMGQIIAQAVQRTGVRAVYVASGDLSHKMKEDGPYGFAKEGPEYDERIMEVCGSGEFDRLLDFDEVFCDKAAECGHRSFCMMAGALDGLGLETERLSHEGTFGVGYGICTYRVLGNDPGRQFLRTWEENRRRALEASRQKEDPWVRLARAQVEAWVRRHERIALPADLPGEMLAQRAGVFVSLHKDGRLRGCIGTIAPTQDSVAAEILENAVSASTKDPRFPPVEARELETLEISVDVLSSPERIDSKEQLDVKRYGVIVTKGWKRGLLLPNLEGVDTVEEQVSIALRKAGLSEREKGYEMERFEVVRHV